MATAPVLLHVFNEAASGNGPTLVHDTSSGTAANATIAYGASGAWTAVAAGNGLACAGTGSATTARLDGTKVQTAIQGSLTASVELVIDSALQSSAYGTYWSLYAASSYQILDLTINHAQGGLIWNIQDGAGEGTAVLPTSGVFVLRFDVDTSQAAGTNRVKVSVNGSPVTVTTNATIAQNTAIDAGASWTAGAGAKLGLGQFFNSQFAAGVIYYAALYVTSPGDNSAALLANNDANPNGGGAVIGFVIPSLARHPNPKYRLAAKRALAANVIAPIAPVTIQLAGGTDATGSGAPSTSGSEALSGGAITDVGGAMASALGSLIYVAQEVSAEDANSSTSSTTISQSITVAAGSAIHVFVTGKNVGTISCADNVNGSYGAALDDVSNGGTLRTAQFSLSGSVGGTVTVTATWSIASVDKGIVLQEIRNTSGLQATAHTGQTQTSPGTGADAISSGNVTPTAQPALLVGLAYCVSIAGADPAITAGTGFSAGLSAWAFLVGFNSARTENKRITSTSALPATFGSTVGTTNTFTTLSAVYTEGSNTSLSLTGGVETGMGGAPVLAGGLTGAGGTAADVGGASALSGAAAPAGGRTADVPGAQAMAYGVGLSGGTTLPLPGASSGTAALAPSGGHSGHRAGAGTEAGGMSPAGGTATATAGAEVVAYGVGLSGGAAPPTHGAPSESASLAPVGGAAAETGGSSSSAGASALAGGQGGPRAGATTAAGGIGPAGGAALAVAGAETMSYGVGMSGGTAAAAGGSPTETTALAPSGGRSDVIAGMIVVGFPVNLSGGQASETGGAPTGGVGASTLAGGSTADAGGALALAVAAALAGGADRVTGGAAALGNTIAITGGDVRGAAGAAPALTFVGSLAGGAAAEAAGALALAIQASLAGGAATDVGGAIAQAQNILALILAGGTVSEVGGAASTAGAAGLPGGVATEGPGAGTSGGGSQMAGGRQQVAAGAPVGGAGLGIAGGIAAEAGGASALAGAEQLTGGVGSASSAGTVIGIPLTLAGGKVSGLGGSEALTTALALVSEAARGNAAVTIQVVQALRGGVATPTAGAAISGAASTIMVISGGASEIDGGPGFVIALELPAWMEGDASGGSSESMIDPGSTESLIDPV